VGTLRTFLVLSLLGCAVPRVGAHIVPIPPSLCSFDPFDLSIPTTGAAGQAQPAGDADKIRLVFDAGQSRIQVCPAATAPNQCGPAVARNFTLGPTTGTLTFPSLFVGRMLASGDLTFEHLPIAFTAGSNVALVPVTLTTALVTNGGQIFEGVPLQGLQSLTLVGIADGAALPAPLTGHSMLLTISCRPLPVPDKDQFALAASVNPIGGEITSTKAKLHATVLTFDPTTPNFGGHPTMLAVHVDGVTVATAIFSNGLQGDRRATATSDDGKASLSIRQQSPGKLSLVATLDEIALPPQSPGGRVLVDVTLNTAGILGRGEQLFHVSRNARKLRSK